MQNASFRVACRDRIYFLKHYAPRLYTAAKVRHSLEIQERLGTLGMPVPRLVRNAGGELVIESDAGTFALSEFVVGNQCCRGAIPAAAALAMGETLGWLHRALATLAESRPCD